MKQHNTLKYLIIHCTATPEGREVSSADIRHWHTDPIDKGGRGWRQVGYTDIFHLDGRVERMVGNNEDMTVDAFEITNGAKGYNAIARHIVYVGGVAADGKAKDNPHRGTAQRLGSLCARLPRPLSTGAYHRAQRNSPQGLPIVQRSVLAQGNRY